MTERAANRRAVRAPGLRALGLLLRVFAIAPTARAVVLPDEAERVWDRRDPLLLRVQVQLDRNRFSPGVIDGIWGRNTALAVYWYQRSHNLEPTGTPDSAFVAHLSRLPEWDRPLVRYAITEDDLSGPYTPLPADPYERSRMECLCYESPAEMLAERFHTTPDMLAFLNPTVDFRALEPRTEIEVPNVDPMRWQSPEGRPEVQYLSRELPLPEGIIETPPREPALARIVVSLRQSFVHALDADGRILRHFPSTLGDEYTPSPTDTLRVVGVALQPTYHFRPTTLRDVPDDRPETILPPGPNSPVGLVWIALGRPGYGIHGTHEPRSIGYAASHGCVRLTNWDALALAAMDLEGLSVEFVE